MEKRTFGRGQFHSYQRKGREITREKGLLRTCQKEGKRHGGNTHSSRAKRKKRNTPLGVMAESGRIEGRFRWGRGVWLAKRHGAVTTKREAAPVGGDQIGGATSGKSKEDGQDVCEEGVGAKKRISKIDFLGGNRRKRVASERKPSANRRGEAVCCLLQKKPVFVNPQKLQCILLKEKLAGAFSQREGKGYAQAECKEASSLL